VKKSLKMAKKLEARQAKYDSLMSDPRIGQRFKSGAHRPGSGKKK
jgi:hypothetical protein